MKKKISKVLALAAAFVLVLGVASVALANTFTPASGYAYATDAVNVRSGPGASYSVLGYLSRAEKVTVTGTVSNGWTQIQLPGSQIGYVNSSYLSSSAVTGSYYPVYTSGDSVFEVTGGALNVRSGPGTNYRVISVLYRGDRVTRIGQDGKWFKIANASGTDAWVSSKYLAGVGGGGSVYVEPASATTMYATTGVNVRSGPGTNYSIVGGLNRGNTVTRTGSSGNWTRINWGSGSAYVYTKYLSASSSWSGSSYVPASGTYIRYANSTLNVRSGPGASYSLLGTVGYGQTVSCVGTLDSWTKILWDGGYGYVYSDHLSSYSGYYGNPWYVGGNVIIGSNSVYFQQNTPLFSQKDMSSSYYMLSVSQGTRATLLAIESNNWAKILYNGTTYYVQANTLGYTN